MADATTKVSFSTSIAHIGSGAALNSGSTVNPASDSSVALVGSGNLGRYPLADIKLVAAVTASVASSANAIILYKQISGENAPGASAKNKYVGAFNLNVTGTAASQTHTVFVENVDISSGDCQFYIENQTNANISAGWTLTVYPKTFVGATS